LAKKKIKLENLDAIIFDFDGVLTDNQVYIDQNGAELVSCSRSDGLAFDVLRILGKPTYILSTEKNPVVSKRSQKLKIPVIQGIKDKAKALSNLVGKKGYRIDKVLYIGNDLNDYKAMTMCGYSVCPADSHSRIKGVATITLKTVGGAGVARELLEDILGLDFIEILYSE
jgi:3-deoxy-D-manno-octulosonate 8-phosphate phosphatase (KDO 8-P phosphatase)